MSEDLPVYTEEYQVKVLSYMLQNPSFREIAKEALSREHLANRALQWYFDTIGDAAIPLTPVTLKEELIKSSKLKLIKEHEVDKLVQYYGFIKQPVVPQEEQHIQDTFVKFVRRQSMKKALIDAVPLIQKEEWDQAISNLEDARNKGLDILSVGHNFFADFEQRLAQRQAAEDARKISTGIMELDSMLYGGLKNKQMGLLIGGTGRGKSIALEWLARTAILLGQQVVYYTLELSAEDIADRFDALFCHVKPQELRTLNTKVYNELHQFKDRFGSNLIIKEYPEDEASINTIKAHYKQLNAIGVRPGLVIVDYIDLMKPHRIYNDVNHEQASVARALRGMTKEFDTRVWSALQLNRGGMSAETPDESGVSGSVQRIFVGDIVIFLAQTPTEREDGVMRLVIKKNRNGPAERTIKIATDFSHMTFYAGPVKGTALDNGQDIASPSDFGDLGPELNLGDIPNDVTLE